MQDKPQRLAYSYIRMSTEKQIRGDSLRRQLEWSDAYAKKHDLVLRSLQDIGVSAWKGKNKQKGKLGDFMRMVKEGVVPSGSYLLVESLDRLSRMTVMDALDLFREILRAGITVVTMGPPEQVYTWDGLNGDFGKLIITLTIMVRANEESERKSTIIRAAMENKRRLSRQGVKTNQSPPLWITAKKIAKGEFEYELNDRAEVVRWIFERSAEGIGFDTIARELNAKGEPTLKPSERGWFHTSVSNIVTSRSAIGEYQPGETVDGKLVARGDPIRGYYPAVVSDDVWLRAQKFVHRNRKGGRAGTRFSNLFDGLAECAHCSSRMYMLNNSRSAKQWQYLVCSANFRKLVSASGINGDVSNVPVCTKGTGRFRYDLAEKFVLDNVMEFGADDLMQMRKVGAELQNANERMAALTLALDDLRTREARLLKLVETEDEAEIPGLLTALKTRTHERVAVEKQLDAARHDRDVLAARQRSLDPASAIQQMRKEWETAKDDATRYGLRVRCNTSMRNIIDWIAFDSEQNVFTVVLFGGLRAYRFPNLKGIRARGATVIPQVVDMGLFIDGSPQSFDAAMAEKVKRLPLASEVSLVNDVRYPKDSDR
ncbi:recombinase family protein [Shinella sumterensis]|uniref:Recombinase family protein n=1 Tax=Shinella sumterensis TaxID=1967501 RepID=A0AA50CKA0_9HYPH|nr:recombinase family protein [Shinella sumterensis]WLR96039.1 recombinase family protein [Shinella sumterensis]